MAIAMFRSERERYYADTCEPLRNAVERREVELAAQVHGDYPGAPLAEHVLPEIRTVGYWDAGCDQVWGLDWHRNEGIELTYVAQGKVAFSTEDGSYLLRPGDLTITRPWQLHRVGAPTITACRLHWLILDVGVRRPNQQWRWPKWFVASAADADYLTRALSHNEQSVWHGDDAIAHYFERLGEAAASFDRPTGESYMRLYVNGLLIALVGLLRQHSPVLDRSLSSTQRTVELFLASLSHQLDYEWDLAAMAAACGLGRSRFTYYCKRLTNMTPNEYLHRCRIQAAADLLAGRPTSNVTEIALRCGFGSSQYFATVFRSHFGCAPREYRLRMLSDAASQHGPQTELD